MVTNAALKSVSKAEQTAAVDADVAKKIAMSWMGVNAVEEALARLDTGIVQWRVAPAVQNAVAAIVAGLISEKDNVMVAGFQPYAWMRAAGMSIDEILCVQLGKILPANVIAATADDIAEAMKAGRMVVAAMHVDNAQGWQDVRAISAAAVKTGAPVALMISASVEAPKGVAVEMAESWADAVVMMQGAIAAARASGAIRVVAVADMESASLEMSMMEAAGITAEDWQNMVLKNADGAEVAVNTAYQAPVKSF